jgi:hypothetical protein
MWPPPQLAARTDAGAPGPERSGDGPVSAWQSRLRTLRAEIDRVEALTLDWPRLGPAVPAYRARPGDLVALEAGGAPAAVVDSAWLPEDLRDLAGTAAQPEPGADPVIEPGIAILADLEAISPDAVLHPDPADRGDAASATSAATPRAQRTHLYRRMPLNGPPDDSVLRAARWAAYFADADAGPASVE